MDQEAQERAESLVRGSAARGEDFIAAFNPATNSVERLSPSQAFSIVVLDADASPALAAIRELWKWAESSPPEVAKFLFQVLDAPQQLIRFQSDVGTADAYGLSVLVRLEPSDRLRDLLAALRAGNFDAIAVK